LFILHFLLDTLPQCVIIYTTQTTNPALEPGKGEVMTERELLEIGYRIAQVSDFIREKTGAKGFIDFADDGTGGSWVTCHGMPKMVHETYVAEGNYRRLIDYAAVCEK
jgi:hypothetical protein